jgi:hypothetical protein
MAKENRRLPNPLQIETIQIGNWKLAIGNSSKWVTDGTRTRDVQDHNLALYQLSYGHRVRLFQASLLLANRLLSTPPPSAR